MQRRQFVMNLLEEIDIDRTIAFGVDLRLGAAHAQVKSFVGADVNEGRGKLLSDLGKPVLDQGQRARLAGSQYMAMRRLRHIFIEVVFEHVVQMAEGLLLGTIMT